MNLAPVLWQRFFDANGVPLSGGQLFSYIAGTSTPLVTYANQGGTPNTNPVVLDGNGYADVWLDPSKSYKFVLEDSSGSILKTIDNVNAVTVFGASGTNHSPGGVPDPGSSAGTTRFLREDATWVAPTIPTATKLASTGTQSGVLFTISTTSTCSVGDTYTNNASTFTVLGALAGVSGQVLFMSGTGTPSGQTGTLTRATGSGTSSISFTAYQLLATYTASSASTVWLIGKIIGGGGGGSGGGAAGGGNGGNGLSSTFGINMLIAGGGAGGTGSTNIPGSGGTPIINSPASGFPWVGGSGGIGMYSHTASSTAIGASGGNSMVGGGGAGGNADNAGGNTGAGTAGGANTGGGGGGGGTSLANGVGGAGGGAGAGIDFVVAYTGPVYYSIGTGGAAGTVGSGTATAGGAGGSGVIALFECVQ